ncbi:orotidine 5'-phosphate decarboxylase [Conoideocrella luteorostrata]|uniref:Orotidine 5'-phosphate decarboxylase n=1 Tax=Conoideocrella luteorostrata TaxID=1105319 RepID=A0AAJ0FYA4_9HYPO|nr:orotidine 5'-phosphate decarboxylase [Conoideocrella luteorostrata]
MLGPYIAVLNTHIDIVHDFNSKTISGLKELAAKHNFLIFEDRKFIDIGSTVQKQYHGGGLRISEWADIVNVSILGGQSVVDALEEVILDEAFPHRDERALLLLAEMTTAGSLAVNQYTQRCVDLVRKKSNSGAVMGFVATRSLGAAGANALDKEDFIVFTTGVNSSQAGVALGQQYETPEMAIQGGSDFIIAGRGIYTAEDPVKAARHYQAKGWAAYQVALRGRVHCADVPFGGSLPLEMSVIQTLE